MLHWDPLDHLKRPPGIIQNDPKLVPGIMQNAPRDHLKRLPGIIQNDPKRPVRLLKTTPGIIQKTPGIIENDPVDHFAMSENELSAQLLAMSENV